MADKVEITVRGGGREDECLVAAGFRLRKMQDSFSERPESEIPENFDGKV